MEPLEHVKNSALILRSSLLLSRKVTSTETGGPILPLFIRRIIRCTHAPLLFKQAISTTSRPDNQSNPPDNEISTPDNALRTPDNQNTPPDIAQTTPDKIVNPLILLVFYGWSRMAPTKHRCTPPS